MHAPPDCPHPLAAFNPMKAKKQPIARAQAVFAKWSERVRGWGNSMVSSLIMKRT
jgi:hypothetical protein